MPRTTHSTRTPRRCRTRTTSTPRSGPPGAGRPSVRTRPRWTSSATDCSARCRPTTRKRSTVCRCWPDDIVAPTLLLNQAPLRQRRHDLADSAATSCRRCCSRWGLYGIVGPTLLFGLADILLGAGNSSGFGRSPRSGARYGIDCLECLSALAVGNSWRSGWSAAMSRRCCGRARRNSSEVPTLLPPRQQTAQCCCRSQAANSSNGPALLFASGRC